MHKMSSPWCRERRVNYCQRYSDYLYH